MSPRTGDGDGFVVDAIVLENFLLGDVETNTWKRVVKNASKGLDFDHTCELD